MKFSIILNSRQRTELLSKLLTSIYEHTSNLDDVEVLISLDSDDNDSQHFLDTMSDYEVNINYEVVARDRNLNRRLTRLAQKSCADNILILNDDCEILNNNWDKLVYNKLSEASFSKDVYYARTKCNSVDRDASVGYCSFPILSRNAVEALGYFMSDKFVGLGADVHIFRIFNSLNRIIDVPLEIRHTLHENLESIFNPDITAQEMRQFTYQHPIDYLNCPINEDLEKIENYLNEKMV